MRGVVPLLGAIMLTVVFAYGLISYSKPDYLVDEATGENVTILGFGAVAVVGHRRPGLGVIMMFRVVGDVAGLLQGPNPGAPFGPAARTSDRRRRVLRVAGLR